MDRRPTGICSSHWPERMSGPSVGGGFRRATRSTLTRPYRYWLVAALIAALIYFAWGEITRTRGAQNVSFRPAKEACGNLGRSATAFIAIDGGRTVMSFIICMAATSTSTSGTTIPISPR